MDDRRGREIAVELDIDFTRSGGVAGLVLQQRFRGVRLNDDDELVWLGPEPPSSQDTSGADRFVYAMVFHQPDCVRELTVSEQDLDERSRPLIERLTELARRGDDCA